MHGTCDALCALLGGTACTGATFGPQCTIGTGTIGQSGICSFNIAGHTVTLFYNAAICAPPGVELGGCVTIDALGTCGKFFVSTEGLCLCITGNNTVLPPPFNVGGVGPLCAKGVCPPN